MNRENGNIFLQKTLSIAAAKNGVKYSWKIPKTFIGQNLAGKTLQFKLQDYFDGSIYDILEPGVLVKPQTPILIRNKTSWPMGGDFGLFHSDYQADGKWMGDASPSD